MVSIPTARSASPIFIVQASTRRIAPFSMASMPSIIRLAVEKTISPITSGKLDQSTLMALNAPWNVLIALLAKSVSRSTETANQSATSPFRSL